MIIEIGNGKTCYECNALENSQLQKQQSRETFIEVYHSGVRLLLSRSESEEKISIQISKQERESYKPAEPCITPSVKPQPAALPKHTIKKPIPKPCAINLGFRGEEAKLRKVVNYFCKELEMLKDPSKAGDLCDLLFSKAYVPGSKKIYLGCYNNVFQYFIDSIEKWFEDLSYSKIGRTESFITKQGKTATRYTLSSAAKMPLTDWKTLRLIESITK